MVAGLAACDEGSATPGFVANESCPTSPPNADAPVVPYSPNPPAVNGDSPVGTAIDEMPHSHIEEGKRVSYSHRPPTSGCHYNVGGKAPMAAGVYTNQVPAEYWVHNLEHGYTVVLYNCPATKPCPDDVKALQKWYQGLKPESQPADCATAPATGIPFGYPKVLVLPWNDMDVPFAAVSWDYYLPLDKLNVSKVQQFYDNHKGKGNESCSG
jgi:hypothetical protein